MPVYQQTISIATKGKGTCEITEKVAEVLRSSGLKTGIVNVSCLHTSASLVIMENADPSARHDLEAFLERLVPENADYFEHTLEGPDDMPSHIKMALTRTSENVPFGGGRLLLGTWQGIFFWEHRARGHRRECVITVYGE